MVIFTLSNVFFAVSKGCFCLSLCYEMCFLSFCCKIGSLSLSLCYKKVFTFNFILLHTVFILKRCSLSLSFCYKRGSLHLLSFCHKRCSPTSSRTSLQAALICTWTSMHNSSNVDYIDFDDDHDNDYHDYNGDLEKSFKLLWINVKL